MLGLNIGKNFDTPNERAVDDYLACLRARYAHASYVAVNISLAQHQGLRDLQRDDALAALLAALKDEQATLADRHGKYTPIAVKIAPDLDDAGDRGIARLLVRHADRRRHRHQHDDRARRGQGPAARRRSRRPVRRGRCAAQATAVVRALAQALDGALPIIGVGGILSGADAREKIDAGATLVQIYTGLIYRGPELVAECVRATRRGAGPRR